MRIHRIRLRHFRGIGDRELSFRDQGVTVIRGDNETGKSSLREAIDLILDLPHDSKDARLRRVKPVDKDVAPEVELAMSVGPYRFCYRKRWLRDPQTVLEIEAPTVGHFTGREAHNRVTEIIAQHADWALWKALHADQGVNLVQAEYRTSRSLVRALDRIASAKLSDDASDNLYARVKQEHDRYYTATGHLKKEHAAIEAQARRAEQAAQAQQARLLELENAIAEHERLEGELRGLRAESAHAQARLSQSAAMTERITALESELERRQAECHLTALRLSEARQRSEARAALIANAERRRELAARAEADRSAVDERVRRAARLRADAAESLAAARKAADDAVRRRERAAADYQYLHDQLDHDQLVERLAAAREGLAAQAQAQAFLAECRIDDGRLREIEGAHLAVEQVRAQLELNKTTLTVEPERELRLVVDGQEQVLEAARPWRSTVGERTVVEVPGVARLVVEPGRGTADLAHQLLAAEGKLGQLLGMTGAREIEEARELNRRRLAMAADLQAAEKRIREACRDLTLEEMARRIEQLATAIFDYAGRRPPEPPLPADLDAARVEREAAESAEHETKDGLAACERALEQAERELAGVQREAERLTALVEQAAAEAEAAEAELARARLETDDAELARAMAAAEERSRAAEAALGATGMELERLAPARVREEERAWRQEADRLAARIRDVQRQLDGLGVRLEIEGAQGLHETAEHAQAEAERARDEWRRVDERAQAARLLYEVLHHYREEAHRRYQAPLREMIEQLGRPVFGDSFSVELNENLQIARRTLDGISLPFADLSTGAREQLCVIERLACAAIVSPEGGAPVILDDALGYSDPRRLDALGTVLGMAASSSQVILLTSSPDRFRRIPDATVIELERS